MTALVQKVPYSANAQTFFAGYALTNLTAWDNCADIRLDRYRDSGVPALIHREFLEFKPKQMILLDRPWVANILPQPQSNQGRHSLTVVGGGISIVAMLGSIAKISNKPQVTGFGLLEVENLDDKPISYLFTPEKNQKANSKFSTTDTKILERFSFPAWKAHADPGHQCLRTNFRRVLELILWHLYFEFPDRKDRALQLMDCCPCNGLDSDEHPDGAHDGARCVSVDTGYYTFNTNNTQYKFNRNNKYPGSDWEKEFFGQEYTNIWGTDQKELDPNGQLDNVFDWERNFRFWELIGKYFREYKICVDVRIKNYIRQRVEKKYGDTNRIDRLFVQGDPPRKWDHNLHHHIFLGVTGNADEINWEAICRHHQK